MSVLERDQIAAAARIVVKVGSSSISGDNAGQIAPLVDALAASHARGAQIVLDRKSTRLNSSHWE